MWLCTIFFNICISEIYWSIFWQEEISLIDYFVYVQLTNRYENLKEFYYVWFLNISYIKSNECCKISSYLTRYCG